MNFIDDAFWEFISIDHAFLYLKKNPNNKKTYPKNICFFLSNEILNILKFKY